jgi:hypothetical protein
MYRNNFDLRVGVRHSVNPVPPQAVGVTVPRVLAVELTKVPVLHDRVSALCSRGGEVQGDLHCSKVCVELYLDMCVRCGW